jgi:hypothetical protein
VFIDLIYLFAIYLLAYIILPVLLAMSRQNCCKFPAKKLQNCCKKYAIPYIEHIRKT